MRDKSRIAERRSWCYRPILTILDALLPVPIRREPPAVQLSAGDAARFRIHTFHFRCAFQAILQQLHALALVIRRPNRINADVATAHFFTSIAAGDRVGKIRKIARFGERVRDILIVMARAHPACGAAAGDGIRHSRPLPTSLRLMSSWRPPVPHSKPEGSTILTMASDIARCVVQSNRIQWLDEPARPHTDDPIDLFGEDVWAFVFLFAAPSTP